MKKILFGIALLVLTNLAIAQNIAITDNDTYTAESSAMLDVMSTSKGMLVPRLTTTQRNAITNKATGLLVFDTTVGSFYFYDGTQWVNLTSGNASGILSYTAPDKVYLTDVNDKFGIGTTAPMNKLDVKADNSNGIDQAIFNVVNQEGDTIFAVYPFGVRINVLDDTTQQRSSTTKGGFAVGGYNREVRGLTNEYLRVTPDSVRIYVEEGDLNRATTTKGGFAVGGYNREVRGNNTDYFNILGSNTAEEIVSAPRIFWYPLKEALIAGRVHVGSADSVGTNSFASGYHSIAMGNWSQALGYQAKAFGDYSTAIGNFAYAETDNSFAFGDYAQARGLGSYAIGSNSVASGNYSTSFGFDNTSSGDYSTSFGKGTTASGQYSFSAGYNSIASGYNSYSLGLSCNATETSSFATGYNSNASAVYSYAMGYNATASNTYAYALGYNATASNSYAYALGSNATASGQYSFAQGNSVQALYTGSIAMGYSSLSNGNYGVAIGYNAEASTDAVAMGRDATATGSSAFALGYSTSSTGTGSYAIGYNATASANYTTAMGYGAIANGLDGVAIGRNADAAWGGVALGIGADAGTGSWGTALGANSEATGSYSIAIGGGVASGSGAIAIGRITASGTNSSGIRLEAGLASDINVTQANTLAIMGGSVGIGVIAPSSTLDVEGSNSGNYAAEFFNDGNGNLYHGIKIQCGTDDGTGTNRMIKCYDGNGGYGGTLALEDNTLKIIQNSDRRLKENIESTNVNALDIIKNLRVVDFNFKTNLSIKHVGYIAQEVEEILPEMSSYDEESDTYGISPMTLIPYLNKAIQQQQEMIDNLIEQNNQLQQRIETLENR